VSVVLDEKQLSQLATQVKNPELLPLANKVYDECNSFSQEKENYTIDPLTIITIMKIMIWLAECMMKWFNSRERAIESTRSLNTLKRWIIRRTATKYAKDRKEAYYLNQGICSSVYNLTDSDRELLFEAVDKEN